MLKFFINSQSKAYLRGLESEFGESSNAIRLELNKFEKAGMLISEIQGNKKIYSANTRHPLHNELHKIVMKYVGLDQIAEHVVGKIGELESVHLVGDYARGLDTGIIDLIFIGNQVDQAYLSKFCVKVEKLIGRKIRFLVYSGPQEMKDGYTSIQGPESLVLWDQSH